MDTQNELIEWAEQELDRIIGWAIADVEVEHRNYTLEFPNRVFHIWKRWGHKEYDGYTVQLWYTTDGTYSLRFTKPGPPQLEVYMDDDQVNALIDRIQKSLEPEEATP